MGISCVKASRAFGPRRLHTQTRTFLFLLGGRGWAAGSRGEGGGRRAPPGPGSLRPATGWGGREGGDTSCIAPGEGGGEEWGGGLTGDSNGTALAVARKVGIEPNHVAARVLPSEKTATVSLLQERAVLTNASNLDAVLLCVAMVKDGVDDALVLA